MSVREFTNVHEMQTHYTKIKQKFYPSGAKPARQPRYTAEPVTSADEAALRATLLGGLVREAQLLVQPGYQEAIEAVLPEPLSVKKMQQVVCAFYGLSMGDLISPRRTTRIVLPRQICMFIARKLTTKTLPEIGRRFGGKDHTTILHGVRKVEALIQNDPDIAQQVAELMAVLQPRQEAA